MLDAGVVGVWPRSLAARSDGRCTTGPGEAWAGGGLDRSRLTALLGPRGAAAAYYSLDGLCCRRMNAGISHLSSSLEPSPGCSAGTLWGPVGR